MKRSKIIFILLFIIITLGNCKKDYLDKTPLGYLDENDLANTSGLERLLIGAYSMLDGIGNNKGGFGSAASNWVYGSICGTEAYKGSDYYDQGDINLLETFQKNANNSFLDSKWAAVYDGVQRANDVLRILAVTKDISQKDRRRISAEARFLRAYYHFEAKKMWDKVPFIDETITYANGNYHVSNRNDIWPDIENDLKYAMDSLDEDSHDGAVGRANKYIAMALLAKAYMFHKKFTEAKPLLEKIIGSGKYELRSYDENFNPETRNGREIIFGIQMSVNDGAPDNLNGNTGDILNFPYSNPYIGGPGGGCCGFFQPSQYLVNHFKTDPNSGLPDLSHFNEVDVKNDNGIVSDSGFTPYKETLDPRLDWTVGRRGIPYFDWGVHPGANWIKDTVNGGPYSPKKNVYYKKQEGQLSGGTSWGAQSLTTNNVKAIRFADVLLWAAEVEADSGSLDKAQEYVNMIRNRMAHHKEYWVHQYLNNNDPSLGFYTDTAHLAANYKIEPYPHGYFTSKGKDTARIAVRYERMLELGMEGHRFFDLVRWDIADIEINAYLQKEKQKRPHLDGAVFEKGCHEYFPIPQLQIDLSAGADGIRQMEQSRPCYK